MTDEERKKIIKSTHLRSGLDESLLQIYMSMSKCDINQFNRMVKKSLDDDRNYNQRRRNG